jgi:hypothetical protein
MAALRAYFDGSTNGGDWKTSKYITLAGFAIDDGLVPGFEAEWNRILNNGSARPAAPYLHMRELRLRAGEFSNDFGWTDEKRGTLIADLLKYIQTLDKQRCRIFACTIDLNDHRRLKSEGSLIAGPIQICNHFCPQVVLAWYVQHFPDFATELNFFFDQGEQFMHFFNRKWLRTKRNRWDVTGNTEAWQLIKTVEATESRQTPCLQVADLYAWGTIRRLCADEGDFMKHLSYIVQQIVPSTTIHLDYRSLLGVRITDDDFMLDFGNNAGRARRRR